MLDRTESAQAAPVMTRFHLWFNKLRALELFVKHVMKAAYIHQNIYRNCWYLSEFNVKRVLWGMKDSKFKACIIVHAVSFQCCTNANAIKHFWSEKYWSDSQTLHVPLREPVKWPLVSIWVELLYDLANWVIAYCTKLWYIG